MIVETKMVSLESSCFLKLKQWPCLFLIIKNVILLFPKIIHFQDMFSQAFPVSDTNGQLNCVM